MMVFRNTIEQYGWPAKALHWVMALLLVSLVALGLYLSELPRGEEKSVLIRLHASSGMLAFFLLILRFGWKLANDGPAPIDGPRWQTRGAKCVHMALYAIVLLQIVTGAMSLMTVGWDLPFFDLFSVPTPFERDIDRHHFWEELHELGWYGFAGLSALHVGAVFYHIVVGKKQSLKRML